MTDTTAEIVIGAAETREQFEARRNAEIQRWRNSKAALDHYKAEELNNREIVSKTMFPNATKGTQRLPVGEGYSVKLVHGFNYTLGDKTLVDPDTGVKISIYEQVMDLEKRCIAEGGNSRKPDAEEIVEKVIKWVPELVPAEYEKLNERGQLGLQIKALIDKELTIKPATPQLTFEEPKSND